MRELESMKISLRMLSSAPKSLVNKQSKGTYCCWADFGTMQIPIQVGSGTDAPKEWVMLELQGDLESRTQERMASKFIGDLHFNKQGVPILIIGHHIMYGKIQQLDKPFAVMSKRKLERNAEPMDTDNTEDIHCNTLSSDGVEYIIKAVIHKKVLFKSRPKPIIAVQSAKVS